MYACSVLRLRCRVRIAWRTRSSNLGAARDCKIGWPIGKDSEDMESLLPTVGKEVRKALSAPILAKRRLNVKWAAR